MYDYIVNVQKNETNILLFFFLSILDLFLKNIFSDPTGPPLNFTIAQVNFSALFLSWKNVEYSKRKGIILKYSYSCQNSKQSIWNEVDNITFQVTVSNLKPKAIYNCTIAACTKVGCGVRSSASTKTLEESKSSADFFFKIFSCNCKVKISHLIKFVNLLFKLIQ